jgi:hypothetical protein
MYVLKKISLKRRLISVRKVHATVLVAFALIGTAPFSIASPSGDTNNNLQSYLTQQPWVKDINAAFSRNRYEPHSSTLPSVDQSSYQGYTTFKGSLQPGGFFMQCTNVVPVRQLIFGESPSELWQITTSPGRPTQIDLVPKDAETVSANIKRPATKQLVVQNFKRQMIDSLNMGIEGLDNAKLTWLSNTQFTSPMLDWAGQETSGKVQVTILSADTNGFPTLMRCQSTSPGLCGAEYTVACSYDSPSLPPSKVLIHTSYGVFTNIIQSVVFGLNSNALTGFTVSEFNSLEGATKSHEIIQSNGLRYAVQEDGRLNAIDQRAAEATLQQAVQLETEALEKPSHVVLIRIAFTVLLISPLIFIYTRFGRRRR